MLKPYLKLWYTLACLDWWGDGIRTGAGMSDTNTWIVFTIQNYLFALPSLQVKEVLYDVPVDSLPFVPPALCGVLLWQGEIYAVLDPALLSGKVGQNSCTYLLPRHASQVCIKITDVVALHTLSEDEIQWESLPPGKDFCAGQFDMEGRQVRIISLEAVVSHGERMLSYV